MTVADSSVLMAAFSSWHDHHRTARSALRSAGTVAHALVETYAVLTRMPPPYRVDASVAAGLLSSLAGRTLLVPTPGLIGALPARLADLGISGGSTYDALIAATTAEAGEQLVSLDTRAATTYRALGVDHLLLA